MTVDAEAFCNICSEESILHTISQSTALVSGDGNDGLTKIQISGNSAIAILLKRLNSNLPYIVFSHSPYSSTERFVSLTTGYDNRQRMPKEAVFLENAK